MYAHHLHSLHIIHQPNLRVSWIRARLFHLRRMLKWKFMKMRLRQCCVETGSSYLTAQKEQKQRHLMIYKCVCHVPSCLLSESCPQTVRHIMAHLLYSLDAISLCQSFRLDMQLNMCTDVTDMTYTDHIMYLHFWSIQTS